MTFIITFLVAAVLTHAALGTTRQTDRQTNRLSSPNTAKLSNSQGTCTIFTQARSQYVGSVLTSCSHMMPLVPPAEWHKLSAPLKNGRGL